MAIVALDSLPVKRLIESAKGSMKLVDATNGRHRARHPESLDVEVSN